MQDLSLHILDIAQNCVRAKASEVTIELEEYPSKNQLTLRIVDNGCGMPIELASEVTNPFVTTRTLRKVGLGLPLLRQNCELCDGKLEIESVVGEGTTVTAIMAYNHIDRVPLGDIASTLITLIQGAPKINFVYLHSFEQNTFRFCTAETQTMLEDVSIQNLEILNWLKMYLNEQIDAIRDNSDKE